MNPAYAGLSWYGAKTTGTTATISAECFVHQVPQNTLDLELGWGNPLGSLLVWGCFGPGKAVPW
ncbi:hypothetical protein OAL43_01440 [bacterium]|nr:hypothetical protein [bacterium]